MPNIEDYILTDYGEVLKLFMSEHIIQLREEDGGIMIFADEWFSKAHGTPWIIPGRFWLVNAGDGVATFWAKSPAEQIRKGIYNLELPHGNINGTSINVTDRPYVSAHMDCLISFLHKLLQEKLDMESVDKEMR